MNRNTFGSIAASGFAVLAAFWLTATPAIAQTPEEPAPRQAAEDASKAYEGEAPCDCPCPDAAEKDSKTKVIYVGPRQNIPLRITDD